MSKYVSYLRVSTTEQGASGLGLEAQRATVQRFVGSGALVAEFTEVESGKRHANRPELLAALDLCRKVGAVLLIAKLDRLSRNVSFISTLMDGDVDLVCCDMPTANRLTLHILAAIAEHERDLISSRTRLALAAAKARGAVLGNPQLDKARALAHVGQRVGHDNAVISLVTEWRGQGRSLRAIASQLNALQIKASSRDPRTRGQWHASSVRNVLATA